MIKINHKGICFFIICLIVISIKKNIKIIIKIKDSKYKNTELIIIKYNLIKSKVTKQDLTNNN